MPYMVTFTINIPQMLAYIPYMDPMGHVVKLETFATQNTTCLFPSCSTATAPAAPRLCPSAARYV